jgi:outer membrane protein TolC
VDLVQSRQALGLAMGLSGDAIDRMPAPGDALPSPVEGWALTAETRSALGDRGVVGRGDLAASRAEIQAAEVLVRAAQRDLEPRLDLQLSLGYSGLEEGEGAETLITPLGGRVGGPDVAVMVDFEWPIQNRAFLGRLARERALLERARIAVSDLERTVRAEIAAAADSLTLEVRAYAAAKVSVALHEQTVLNQRRRLRSELTTAIDVLITEERLTGALLSALATEYRYALGVTRLRFATASLIPASGSLDALDATRLSHPPEPGKE